jgi:hypothetical protein
MYTELITDFFIYAYFAFNFFFAGAIFEDNYEDETIHQKKLYVALVLLFMFGTIYFIVTNVIARIDIWLVNRRLLKVINNAKHNSKK